MRITKLCVAGLASAVVLGACSSGGSSSAGGDTSSTTAPTTDASTLTVRTPASSQSVVDQLVAQFRRGQAGTKVAVVAANQQALTAALKQGTAGITVVPDVALAGLKGLHTGSFGSNQAVIAVPADNPRGVVDVKAFSPTSGLKTAVCGPDSSLGNFGTLALSKSKITPNPATVSGKSDCSANALSQLASHKLDAALMFRNDLKVPAGVKLLTIPAAQNVTIPITYVVGGTSAPTKAFVTFLGTPPAQQILTKAGYLP